MLRKLDARRKREREEGARMHGGWLLGSGQKKVSDADLFRRLGVEPERVVTAARR